MKYFARRGAIINKIIISIHLYIYFFILQLYTAYAAGGVVVFFFRLAGPRGCVPGQILRTENIIK